MKDEVLNYAKEGSVVIVDHIDGNVFNNTRNNLRVRTQSENNMNKQLQKNNTTGIVGVSWNVKSKMWTAYITKDRKRVNLGHYYYLRNAVKARVDAEDEYFGEHSYRNRDENYRDYIDSLLNLPNKEEPFIIKVRSDTTVCVGVSFLKSKNKYRARIEENGKVECVLFDSLDDAVRWRKLKDIEYYGNNIIYSNKKIDREI
ncbi:HNH endonuclease [Bacillus phage PBC2]|uniref:HNH endonuclease n=1 Tax=Bacillus phage PBC2 TaxID=1675029 RepID=A0A218KC10_9CAUD|nr:HNH endonuclease [Bacillus phage PBC2]AKQ08439.1 hypothetical protein PBC2_124 [Bacillus phage PBC2]